MRNIGFIKSLAATISAAATATATATATKVSTARSSVVEASTTLSSQLLSSLDRNAPKNQPDPSLSLSSPPDNNSAEDISTLISQVLHDEGENEETKSISFNNPPPPNKGFVNNLLGIEFTPNTSLTPPKFWQKDFARERKKQHIFKNNKSKRSRNLLEMCATKFGTDSTLELFTKLGRETGLKEYNALIRLCIDKARSNSDEDESMVHIHHAYTLLELMREKGFVIKEESFGTVLLYLVDFKMVEEFEIFSNFIKEENPRASSRIGYYEMLLNIRVCDEEKILELCLQPCDDDSRYSLSENYLLAFCESDREKEMSILLEHVDINKVSKPKYVINIFQSLGRLKLEKFAEKFLSDLHKAEMQGENFANMIYEYVTSVPNLTATEMVSKFRSLHEKFDAVSLEYHEKFISYFCDLSLINEALDVIEHMGESGLNVTIELFNQVINACDQNCDLHMVHDIYSTMCKINFKPEAETFKTFISLCVKMRDFEGAYKMLSKARETGQKPTTSMFNSIMAGFFREKNGYNAQMVMNQMQNEGVKPDGDTFSYLFALSESENDISKYWDELRKEGVHVTKSIFTGLIHAYAKLGNFDMVKKVVMNPEVPVKYMVEIKSTLVSALASNGEISEALEIYHEIKQNGSNLEHKAIMSLIEHTKTEGEMEKMTKFLNELKDSIYWFDGCCRVILYCVQHNYIDEAIALLIQLKEKDKASAYKCIDQIFCHARNLEPVRLEMAMRLLRAIKEELGLRVSRTSLDFLLSMCVKAKDSSTARIVWKEYELAGLPYNVLTFLRMYQSLLASREVNVAKEILKHIACHDSHVRLLVKACKQTYSTKNKKKKKKKNK